MVVVVQVRLFIERFAARHRNRLYFAGVEQGVDGAVDGRLADFCLTFLRHRDEVGNRQRPVGFHDDVVDNAALLGLALADFDHAGIIRDRGTALQRIIVLCGVSEAPDTKAVELTADDLEAFKAHARQLAGLLKPPLLVLVSGDLGAGKTTFVSEVLRAWGISGAASPTFNLRNDYDANGLHVIHLDFYRLKPNDTGLDLLPPDEDYESSIVFAEWPEKAQPALFQPFANRARLAIETGPGNRRKLIFEAGGVN